MTASITIRNVRQLAELRQLVTLQRTYWGTDSEAVIPAHMLFSLANNGGHALAAFDGSTPIGVLVGFLGTSEDNPTRPAMANLQIVSKRMVVLTSYRGQGIGYRLKRAQRDMAVAQGIRLVTWTFDPLLAQNAHLNIRKLGGIAQQYLPDYYGVSDESGLAPLGSSDRLLVEWWVTNRRVEERMTGSRRDLTLSHYLEAATPILNPTRLTDDGALLPSEVNDIPAGSMALLEIPTHYDQMAESNPSLAKQWRTHTRALFAEVAQHGFIITDFVRQSYQGRDRAFYLLSYNGPAYDVNVN